MPPLQPQTWSGQLREGSDFGTHASRTTALRIIIKHYLHGIRITAHRFLNVLLLLISHIVDYYTFRLNCILCYTLCNVLEFGCNNRLSIYSHLVHKRWADIICASIGSRSVLLHRRHRGSTNYDIVFAPRTTLVLIRKELEENSRYIVIPFGFYILYALSFYSKYSIIRIF